jgi:predicted acyltransferase
MGPPALELPKNRLASVDTYRGLVMFLMMAEVLDLRAMASAYPTAIWKFLAWHQTHVDWAGCSLHDLIQPSFSLLVGVAVPFSIASRLAKGQSRQRMVLHAAWRAFALCFLGVFLRLLHSDFQRYTFEDTLSQIGLGYLPLFLLGFARPRWQVAALVAILAGYWLLFALYPLPPEGFYSMKTVGVPPDWPHHYVGFQAHWNMNSNPAWAFDTVFLNLFPQGRPFLFNGGGYATLSFIPTLGTMILGLLAGNQLKSNEPAWNKIRWLLAAGLVMIAISLAIDYARLGPIVKRIWTPTWTLYSGAYCYWILAGLYSVIDVAGWKAWSFPLRVIGANSIVAYVMAELAGEWMHSGYESITGHESLPALEQFSLGVGILALYWLVLFAMYKFKWFMRI